MLSKHMTRISIIVTHALKERVKYKCNEERYSFAHLGSRLLEFGMKDSSTSNNSSVLDGNFSGVLNLDDPDLVARFDDGKYERPIVYSFDFETAAIRNSIPASVAAMEPDVVDYLMSWRVWVVNTVKVRAALESGKKLPWAKFVGEK